MNIEDFGIEHSNTFTLDEKGGRELLASLHKLPTFNQSVEACVLLFLHHYVGSHLDKPVPEIRGKDLDERIPAYRAFATHHPAEFEQATLLFEKHLFLWCTMFASLQSLKVTDDDNGFLKCGSLVALSMGIMYPSLLATQCFDVYMSHRRGAGYMFNARAEQDDMRSTISNLVNQLEGGTKQLIGEMMSHPNDYGRR